MTFPMSFCSSVTSPVLLLTCASLIFESDEKKSSPMNWQLDSSYIPVLKVLHDPHGEEGQNKLSQWYLLALYMVNL